MVSEKQKFTGVSVCCALVIIGLAASGTISQGLGVVVLALFIGFASYGYVLMNEENHEDSKTD